MISLVEPIPTAEIFHAILSSRTSRPKWRNGRRDGLKNRWAARLMWVRLPPSAPILNLTSLADATSIAVRISICSPFVHLSAGDVTVGLKPRRRTPQMTEGDVD